MSSPSTRVRILIDVALLGWAVAWIVIGIQVGRDVHGISQLSNTVVLAGSALEQTGNVLDQIGRIPIVGQPIGDLANRIRQTGKSARVNARQSRGDIQDLGALLAVAIALIPTIPLAAIWLPLRVRWRRERRAVRRALATESPELEGLLAERARAALPLDEVLALGDDRKALAEAELFRLGLRKR